MDLCVWTCHTRPLSSLALPQLVLSNGKRKHGRQHVPAAQVEEFSLLGVTICEVLKRNNWVPLAAILGSSPSLHLKSLLLRF